MRALAAKFSGTSKLLVQLATGCFVGPNILIDSFMADGQQAMSFLGASDLLRTIVEMKVLQNEQVMMFGELSIAS